MSKCMFICFQLKCSSINLDHHLEYFHFNVLLVSADQLSSPPFPWHGYPWYPLCRIVVKIRNDDCAWFRIGAQEFMLLRWSCCLSSCILELWGFDAFGGLFPPYETFYFKDVESSTVKNAKRLVH